MLDGSRVDATTYTAEGWSELQESEDRKRMVMPVCGIRAVAKTRGPSTRYFAHHRKNGCKVEHGGETPQHLAMKEALKLCIDNVPGWHAIVEHPHPSREWIIDVLAESDDFRARVAFEVQLSSQSPQNYFVRSQRYFESGAFPVWLIPRPLEPHQTKVPTVVTGFGKTSPIPDDVSRLLALSAGQEFVTADDRLGVFVEALLQRGHSWTHGSPGDQAARQKAEAERVAEAAKAQRKKQEAFEQAIAEMNDRSASPESAFGPHTVLVDTDTFVWGSLTSCWNCEEPMLVWDARSPGFRKRWARVPRPAVKSEVGEKRFENHPEVHRAVDKWMRVAGSDIAKAAIKPRRTKASGRLYAAFVCPSCDSTMGQFFISCVRPEKWSILSGPAVEPPPPAPTAKPSAAPRSTVASARTAVQTVTPPRPAAGAGTLRCRLHSAPKQGCDYCRLAQS
ncbi:hypothetical protein SRABI83_00084 [Arthrobacter sp. Bi83]|uniref:competence protein CoiA family protein n=1 Tax=Arthrobacter sp. Bi83 TaxID=2822353 RepID=UPI001D8C61F8|nr:competence protein CoiA family protein [Arthrobacter sp. Bi83]CAH0126196.1 hypothetical protein SRABI83_00084 [Arthrobacter sp. Bi83]